MKQKFGTLMKMWLSLSLAMAANAALSTAIHTIDQAANS
jgi:hypothetical protein